MAYADFTLSRLIKQFSLTLDATTDLFASVKPASLSFAFEDRLTQTFPLSVDVSTEKARSEFIIAPILTEFWFLGQKSVGLHSGVEFSVEPENGLSGTCDYIITLSPGQLVVKAPIILLVEAKNEELKRGYAQCIAAMIAACRFNDREETPVDKIYGAVTTGELWRFLEMEGSTVRVDSVEYPVMTVAKIIGILLHMSGALEVGSTIENIVG